MEETFKKSRDKNAYPYFAAAKKSLLFKVSMIYSSCVGCKDDQEMNHRRQIQQKLKNINFRVSTLLNYLEIFEYFVKFAVLLHEINSTNMSSFLR